MQVEKSVGPFSDILLCCKPTSFTPERKAKDWTYSFPEFINVQAPFGMDIANEAWERRTVQLSSEGSPQDPSQDSLESILERGIKAWDKSWEMFFGSRRCAMVIGVDQLHGGRPQSDPLDTFDAQEWLSANRLELRFSEPRQGATARELIRKRFSGSPDSGPPYMTSKSYLATLQNGHALILYLTSPRSDRHNLAHLSRNYISASFSSFW